MQTVAELFRILEKEKIAYAVLRNYEVLPELRGEGLTRNTDIDLVADSRELPRIRELLAGVARRFDWDVLTECEHFQRSHARHHNIEIFQFYRLAPLEYLQIDVFHGYLAWGLPLMDEEEMLRGRIHDSARGLTHIDSFKENLFRLLQIHGLGRSARTSSKRARYRVKIQQLCCRNEYQFLALVRQYLGPSGVNAVRALRSDDEDRYLRAIPLGKAYFFCRYALRHPFSTLAQVLERIRENRLRFHDDPCGCLLNMHAAGERTRASLRSAMETLLQLNVLDEWAEEASGVTNERQHNILEQGGIVVRWTDRFHASVEIEAADNPDEIAAKVLNSYANRHRTLYANPHRLERSTSLVQ